MPVQILNATTTNDYKDTGVGLQGGLYGYGTLIVGGPGTPPNTNAVSILFHHGVSGGQSSPYEYVNLPPGTYPLFSTPKDRIVGLQFKSAVAGSAAVVSCILYEPDMAGLSPQSVTPPFPSGGIQEITSVDGSVVITNPFGPIVDLSVFGDFLHWGTNVDTHTRGLVLQSNAAVTVTSNAHTITIDTQQHASITMTPGATGTVLISGGALASASSIQVDTALTMIGGTAGIVMSTLGGMSATALGTITIQSNGAAASGNDLQLFADHKVFIRSGGGGIVLDPVGPGGIGSTTGDTTIYTHTSHVTQFLDQMSNTIMSLSGTVGDPMSILVKLLMSAQIDMQTHKIVNLDTPTANADATTKLYVDTATGLLIPKSAFGAKGDILVGTGASTFNTQNVGSNGYALFADSTQTTGVKWAPVSGSGSPGSVVATDTIWDNKGDLAAATGADAASKLAAGADALFLTTDSSQSTGLKWAGAEQEVAGTYTEFTSNVSVTHTSEGTADTVVTAGAFTANGTSVYMVEFYCMGAAPSGAAGGRSMRIILFEGSTALGQMALIGTPAAGVELEMPVRIARRLTPTAASHTYTIKAIVNAGTGTVYAGAGGAGNFMPGWVRVIKIT